MLENLLGLVELSTSLFRQGFSRCAAHVMLATAVQRLLVRTAHQLYIVFCRVPIYMIRSDYFPHFATFEMARISENLMVW